jgi:putative addiction module component (TIGR02574 family)
VNLETIVSEVECWPVDDRLELIERIWDGIDNQNDEPELTDELKALLDRRIAALEANPQAVTTWEAIKESVRRAR